MDGMTDASGFLYLRIAKSQPMKQVQAKIPEYLGYLKRSKLSC